MSNEPPNKHIHIRPDLDYTDEFWWDSGVAAGNSEEALQIIGQLLDVLDLVDGNQVLATDARASEAILQIVPRMILMETNPPEWHQLVDSVLAEMVSEDRPVAMPASGFYSTIESAVTLGLLCGLSAGLIAEAGGWSDRQQEKGGW